MNKLKISKKLGFTGLGLCVLCCALPLIGFSVGVASLTAIAFYIEKVGILLIGLAVILFFYYRNQNKKENSCSVDCTCKEHSLKNDV